MSAHTPGPWKFGKTLSSTSGEWLISLDFAGHVGNPVAAIVPATGNEYANARLIAAAPDLLAALSRLIGGLETMQDNLDAARQARAAINKATGQ